MNFYFLSPDNLSDNFFIREFAAGFDRTQKGIIIHGLFGSIDDTRFVTRRISSLLSESLIVNFPISGEQRSLFYRQHGELALKAEILNEVFRHSNVVVTNLLYANEKNETEAGNAHSHLQLLRKEFNPHHIFLFPSRSLSPLGVQKVSVENAEDYQKLLAAYSEEKNLLDFAFANAPVVIASAKSAFPKV